MIIGDTLHPESRMDKGFAERVKGVNPYKLIYVGKEQ
jgi:hypothetical protein